MGAIVEKISMKVKVAWLVIAAVSLILKGISVGMAGKALYGAESISVSASTKELPIYCVDTAEKKVALSFDAAWGAEDTFEILDILDKYNVKVTFFMTGGWVKDFPDMVKEIYARGHDLGNHSENHKEMSKLSDAENRQELQKVHDSVRELTGYEMFLFRPPYGDYDSELIKTVKDMGYYAIQWSIDSLDWKDYGRESIISRVVESKYLDNGAIILCHNGAKYTASALEDLIVGVQQKGYEFVKISDLIIRENYHMDVTGKQIAD
jgi:polysaccharide deacetylase family sporulation protein PdaB